MTSDFLLSSHILSSKVDVTSVTVLENNAHEYVDYIKEILCSSDTYTMQYEELLLFMKMEPSKLG